MTIQHSLKEQLSFVTHNAQGDTGESVPQRNIECATTRATH